MKIHKIIFYLFYYHDCTRVLRQGRLIPIGDIFAGGSLAYLNEDDSQNLAYGFRANIGLKHNNHRPTMSHVPFHGYIWLLTSERNASSWAMFASQDRFGYDCRNIT